MMSFLLYPEWESNPHATSAHGPQPCLSTNSSIRVTNVYKSKKVVHYATTFCDLAGARTQDPLLKREMLYQLSYQVFS